MSEQERTAGRRIVAAVTDDSAARAVLRAAVAVCGLFSATAEAMHVAEAPGEDAALAQAAREAEIELTTTSGQPIEQIAAVAGRQDVVALVLGARGRPADGRPAGRTALALLESIQKPLLVVTGETVFEAPVRRVLVPLDGTQTSAAALEEIVGLASAAAVEVVVAHVRQRRALPAFNDHLPHEVRAWSEEFLARHCPAPADLELRVGDPDEHLLDICRRSGCDLVALGWAQNLGAGHAAVVRRMLEETPVPLLLTPVSRRQARATRRSIAPAEGARSPELASAGSGPESLGSRLRWS